VCVGEKGEEEGRSATYLCAAVEAASWRKAAKGKTAPLWCGEETRSKTPEGGATSGPAEEPQKGEAQKHCKETPRGAEPARWRERAVAAEEAACGSGEDR
jgi:hypothetical protein